jgi:hypothetical protein
VMVPGVDLSCVLDALDEGIPHRIFICYEDEDLALRTALTASRLWSAGEDSVVVRLNQLARHNVFNAPSRISLLDDVLGRLRLISVTNLACRPDAIHEDLVEMLARSMHHQYLVDQLRAGTPLAANGSMRPWEDLREAVREANRVLARDVGGKLAKIGATVAPRTGASIPFEFTDQEVEWLAVREHERWCEERRSAGWRHSKIRNDTAKRHPSLVPWDHLSMTERSTDRQAVLGLTSVLNNVGLRIVRLNGSRGAPDAVALPALSNVEA